MSVQDNQCVHCPELKMWLILAKEIETLKQEIKKIQNKTIRCTKKIYFPYVYSICTACCFRSVSQCGPGLCGSTKCVTRGTNRQPFTKHGTLFLYGRDLKYFLCPYSSWTSSFNLHVKYNYKCNGIKIES